MKDLRFGRRYELNWDEDETLGANGTAANDLFAFTLPSPRGVCMLMMDVVDDGRNELSWDENERLGPNWTREAGKQYRFQPPAVLIVELYQVRAELGRGRDAGRERYSSQRSLRDDAGARPPPCRRSCGAPSCPGRTLQKPYGHIVIRFRRQPHDGIA